MPLPFRRNKQEISNNISIDHFDFSSSSIINTPIANHNNNNNNISNNNGHHFKNKRNKSKVKRRRIINSEKRQRASKNRIMKDDTTVTISDVDTVTIAPRSSNSSKQNSHKKRLFTPLSIKTTSNIITSLISPLSSSSNASKCFPSSVKSNHTSTTSTIEEEKLKMNKNDNENEEHNDVNVGQSLNLWMTNMNELVTSPVFQNAIFSTFTLTSAIMKSIYNATIYYPIMRPIQNIMTFSNKMINSSLTFVQHSVLSLVNNQLIFWNNNNNYQRKITADTDHCRENKNNHDEHGDNFIRDIAHHTVPVLYNTTNGIFSFFFGGLGDHCDNSNNSNVTSEMPSTPCNNEQSEHTTTLNEEQNEKNDCEEDDDQYIQLIHDSESEHDSPNDIKQHCDISSNVTLVTLSTADEDECIQQEQNHDNSDDQLLHNSSLPSFYIRVCDLNLYTDDAIVDRSMLEDEKKEDTTSNHGSLPIDANNIIDPTNKQILHIELKQSINSYNESSSIQRNIIRMINVMVETGLEIAMSCGRKQNRSKGNIVSWKEEGSTTKMLNRIESNNEWYTDTKLVQSLENDVLLWSGTKEGQPLRKSTSYVHNVPFFKGRGIIPSMSAKELTYLLLDSSKVKLYNKWSNGRIDKIVYEKDIEKGNGMFGIGSTKIVENETNVPFSNNNIVVTTFIHARRVALEKYKRNSNDNVGNAYIIVSRSLQKQHTPDSTVGQMNEIIWGVTLLRDIPGHPGKTDLLTLTQANSPAIPGFLAHKVGLKCVSDYFKNIRSVDVSQLNEC